jgi:hypothetical protein
MSQNAPGGCGVGCRGASSYRHIALRTFELKRRPAPLGSSASFERSPLHFSFAPGSGRIAALPRTVETGHELTSCLTPSALAKCSSGEWCPGSPGRNRKLGRGAERWGGRAAARVRRGPIPNGCWQSLEYFGSTRSLFSSTYFKCTLIYSRSLVSIFSTWRLSAFW